ncbi:putative ABC transport system permease protein [Anseongella ginsenosidimutans]|uniref:Putative ABC transport system permease protein n=1 Tax=Anseongella ginsenosidimutans TaxID=496056 RepID=A0A4R3KNW6_9SPHI|nr:ABC transporter permease [Anseongella ginsenosidimutans]QEC52441.1 FtsX-like permease family protein [Anseongella ginsenosidimutans]TCS85808.1 putative ABC transport system permease protein [Anseongella ginsenosidimutans]
MLKNYFRIARRNLWKNKAYSFINITGLAVGLAGFILLLLYLNHELSYDTWDPSLKRVYKISVQTEDDIPDGTPGPLADFLHEKAALVDAATRMSAAGDFEVLLQTGDKKIYQTGTVEADSNFFKVFPYRIVQGNAATALTKPNAMVLSTAVAKKLFGDAPAVGKMVRVYDAFDCEVTALMETPDKPSYLDVQLVYRPPYPESNYHWNNWSYDTYIKTGRIMPLAQVERELDRIYYAERLKKGEQSWEEFHAAGHRAGLFAEAMPQLHNFPRHGKSNFATVSVLLALAGLLLFAGVINFSNLSVAAGMRRAKEVGVRKSLGSGKRSLLFQFMGETALQCFLSLVLAILLVTVLLPVFNREFGISLNFLDGKNALLLTVQIIVCLLTVILLSGLYPGIFLSRCNTVSVLKGSYSSGKSGTRLRNALVMLQFVVSAFFITGTLIVSRQLNFMQTKDKGFSAEQVMRLQATQQTREADFEQVRNSLLAIPGVREVSKTTVVPGDLLLDTSTFAFKYQGESIRMASVKVSEGYFNTLSIDLLKGRLFEDNYADKHTRTAVINEAAARRMNLQEPGEAYITFPYCDTVPVKIIGIVKDFQVAGFKEQVLPSVFTVGNEACMYQSGGAILVKLHTNDLQESIASIEAAWKKIEPAFPIRYSFLDSNFERLLTSYTRLQKIISFFSLTAIAIAAMGLFALTTFLVGRRTKEIGIRKVLGAGTAELGLLLSKDFLLLVMAGAALAVPLTWWAAGRWLNGFAYRMELEWWLFALSGLLIVLLALLLVGFQSVKAAMMNPVKSLRIE